MREFVSGCSTCLSQMRIRRAVYLVKSFFLPDQCLSRICHLQSRRDWGLLPPVCLLRDHRHPILEPLHPGPQFQLFLCADQPSCKFHKLQLFLLAVQPARTLLAVQPARILWNHTHLRIPLLRGIPPHHRYILLTGYAATSPTMWPGRTTSLDCLSVQFLGPRRCHFQRPIRLSSPLRSPAAVESLPLGEERHLHPERLVEEEEDPIL